MQSKLMLIHVLIDICIFECVVHEIINKKKKKKQRTDLRVNRFWINFREITITEYPGLMSTIAILQTNTMYI